MTETNDKHDFTYLSGLTDEELINAFNREVGNPGWGAARAAYLAKIEQEFLRRDFDLSLIKDEGGLSMARKVRVEEVRVLFTQNDV